MPLKSFLTAYNAPSLQWRYVFALGALVLASCHTLADDQLTEEDYFADIPLVISATRLPQPVSDTPVAITVLDRAMIEASGFIEIPDLFRLVPGFQVGLSWRDHHTAVTYHGQSDGLSRRMQVLIDGRVALGTLFGLVDWDRLGITVDDIERIEVVRGPSGAAYGSHAFIGAINIVTREPFANPGWRFSAATGSQETDLFSAQYAHAGKDFDYRAAFTYYDTEGFDNVNDESTSRAGRFQGRYQIDSASVLDFQLGYAEGPWGRGGLGSAIDPMEEKDASEQYGNFRFTRSSSPGNEWYIQLGVSETEEEDLINAGLLSDLLGVDPLDVPVLTGGQQDQIISVSVYDYVSSRVDVEFQQQILFDEKRRALWGAGYRQDKVDSAAVIGLREKEEMETFRLYGNLEYGIFDNILLNIGALFEDTTRNSSEIYSRVGLNYTLADGHVIRLAVAEGYRQPFVAEAFHDVAIRFDDDSVLEQIQLAPEQLEAEEITSYELGYIGNWFDNRLNIEVKAFREELENEIEYPINLLHPESLSLFNPGSIYSANGGETEITGVETGIKWQVSKATRLWVSYSFAEVDQHWSFRCEPFLTKDATPRHTASLLISHDFSDDWQVSMGYYYLDDMAWILWGGDVEAYDRIDARIAKSFQLQNAELKLELIGQNLGGDYQDFNPRNNFETRAFVRVSLQFH